MDELIEYSFILSQENNKIIKLFFDNDVFVEICNDSFHNNRKICFKMREFFWLINQIQVKKFNNSLYCNHKTEIYYEIFDDVIVYYKIFNKRQIFTFTMNEIKELKSQMPMISDLASKLRHPSNPFQPMNSEREESMEL